jgi:hypothetical protein
MSVPRVVVVAPEKAEHIDNIFEGLQALGCQLAMSADGIRDGVVLRRVFKKHSLEAQQFCLAAGVLAAEGWLSMVVVQGQFRGFIRTYPAVDAPALPKNVLQFPRGKCEKRATRATSAVIVRLMKVKPAGDAV